MKWFKKKTYKTHVVCFNCDKDITIKIPVGVKVSGYRFTCPNCDLVSTIRSTKSMEEVKK